MGSTITLSAIDGFTLKAYRADPEGDARGGIVVIQEIFGVNDHIRSVADGYAAQGYSVIAPQLYDRSAPDIELGYTQGDVKRAATFGLRSGSINRCWIYRLLFPC